MFGQGFDIDKWLEERREAERLRCPHCGHIYEGESLYENHVSYYGDKGIKEEECPHCGEIFFVDEFVRRTYTCAKTAEELE